MAQLRLSRFMSEVSLLESNIRIPRSCVLLRFEWTRVTGAAQSRDVCVCWLRSGNYLLKRGRLKTRDWKTRHQTAGVENAGVAQYGKPKSPLFNIVTS